jgi:hypothetical protein
MPTVFTVGHSTRTIAEFVGLLRQAAVARPPAHARIRGSTLTLCRTRSLALGSPTVICPPSAVCGTEQKERCRRPIRSGGPRLSEIMLITRQLTRSEGNWTNCERSPMTIAAPLCVLKPCGGAATAASSPTICWRKGFRWRISCGTIRSTPRRSRLVCDRCPAGRSYIQPLWRRSKY